ncbi:MAG TPA: non-heme iron oxygenase ferredoxin subunit [Deltaproteobacteria bacterium]|nr:non-heme iron oxygenase ferredoxin subunit [Deltaproteobacteria bacterium]
MSWQKIAKKQDIPPGSGIAAECAGQAVALFNVDGNFHAVQGRCPHRGGPLGEGELQGKIVTCPWHAWSFDVCSGANVDNPSSKLICFPVQVEGDDVLVETNVQS